MSMDLDDNELGNFGQEEDDVVDSNMVVSVEPNTELLHDFCCYCSTHERVFPSLTPSQETSIKLLDITMRKNWIFNIDIEDITSD